MGPGPAASAWHPAIGIGTNAMPHNVTAHQKWLPASLEAESPTCLNEGPWQPSRTGAREPT
eukprot:5093911-Heterocapsa_arctica.AAC.1